MISEEKDSPEAVYLRLINKTEDYVEQHLSTAISLMDLARYTNFSSFQFHRIFKKYSSETLNQFVTRLKLERAAIFISVNRGISLTEVALSYGYNDASTFSKAFKRHFGCSPSAYRKQQELTRNS